MSSLVKRRRIIYILIFLAIIFTIFITTLLANDRKNVYESNADIFSDVFSIISFDETNPALIDNLSDFTSFEWDYVLFFGPYQSKERIIDEVGYEWTNGIITNINEGTNQVVFMHGSEVVCHIQGYPDRYGVYFEVFVDNSTGFTRLDIDDNLNFEISNKDDYYLLRYMGEE